MSSVYFISDTHFGHFNILKYEPIRVKAMAEYMTKTGYGMDENEALAYINSCLEQNTNQNSIMNIHDEMLISYWNSTVKPDDTVWFLGDFAFAKHIGLDRVREIGNKLKGHKKMILGNHDREPVKFYYSCGFEFVSPYPVQLKKWFILSHAPSEYITANMPFYNIFGHVHSHSAFLTETSNSYCVCIERQNFRPIQIAAFNDFNEAEDTNPAGENR